MEHITVYALSPTRKHFWWIAVRRDKDGRPILRSIRLHCARRPGT
jgi:hypothetical protein